MYTVSATFTVKARRRDCPPDTTDEAQAWLSELTSGAHRLVYEYYKEHGFTVEVTSGPNTFLPSD